MAEDERGISTEVGSSLLFENERLRIWEMTLGPGEACHLHQHLYDYAFVYVTQSTIEVTDGDGHAWSNSFGDGFVQFNPHDRCERGSRARPRLFFRRRSSVKRCGAIVGSERHFQNCSEFRSASHYCHNKGPV